jgi:hypothetical protein
MALWNKLLGRSAATPVSEPTVSTVVEIISGKLSARVYLHEISSPQGPIACWSYVSEGLMAHQQAELVFTLRRDPGEPSDGFPQDPLHLFAKVHELADSGQRVTSGGVTHFGGRKFFEHHLIYVSAQPMAGVALPPSCLAAVLVTDDELRAAGERMGQASSHYPFPPWADRRRRGLSLERTFEASLLSKIQRASAHGLRVGMSDNQITMFALRSEQPLWQDRLAQIPDGAPFAFLTALDPTANGCLVWVPGQKAPEAIVPPGPPGSNGTRVCGCFIVFIADQPGNGGKILEDGFAMELTGEAWQAIRNALTDGKNLSVPATGDGMPFALTWRDDMATDGRVTIGQVQLLTPEDQLAARTSARDLAVFCRDIQRCAVHVLADHDGRLDLLVRASCTPHGHQFGLSRRGQASDETLQALVDALEQIARLPVRDGEVSFEVQLTVAAAGSRDAPA